MTYTKSQQFWIDHFKACAVSGLSQIEYCRQYGLNKSSFSAQKSELKKLQNIRQNDLPVLIPLKKTAGGSFFIKINSLELTFPDAPAPEWMASLINHLEVFRAGHQSV